MNKKKNINGLLIFNKPIGITSNDTLKKIKKIFSPNKAGYIGSLDPIASGLLIISFGKYTKLFDKIIKKKKTYNVTIKLGETTNTYDAYGFIKKKQKINFSKKKLYNIISKFKGKINQNIPIYSSCKFKGKPLYKYAIKGIKIKKKKKIYIHNIMILKYEYDILKLKIICSKGTYIRSIVHNIGKKLKCGAYILKLKRIQIGKIKIKHSSKFKDIRNINKKKILTQYKNKL